MCESQVKQREIKNVGTMGRVKKYKKQSVSLEQSLGEVGITPPPWDI